MLQIYSNINCRKNFVFLKKNIENIYFSTVFIVKIAVITLKTVSKSFCPRLDQNEHDILNLHPFLDPFVKKLEAVHFFIFQNP